MPPKRFAPNQTVALCGLRSDISKDDILKAVKKSGCRSSLAASEPSNLHKDRSDVETDSGKKRHLAFLNCTDKDAAKQMCKALNEKREETLGLEKHNYVLQAVLKSELSKVTWERFTVAMEKATVEGKISKKTRTECYIEQPTPVTIEKAAFEGTDEDWNQLKVGNTLRVVASRTKGSNERFQASEAVRVAEKKTLQQTRTAKAEKTVLSDALAKVSAVLEQNLKGKGWVPLNTIGQWFTGSAEREALSLIKMQHKQLKNFVACCDIVEVRECVGGYELALVADLEMTRAAMPKEQVQEEKESSKRAKQAVVTTEVETGDESKEEHDGRVRCYRFQRAIIELVPKILGSVLRHAWQRKTGSAWSSGSGKQLANQIKKPGEAERRIGRKGLDKVRDGDVDKWDITLLALMLVDDPGLLSDKAVQNAVRSLRSLRNEFVHDLQANPTVSEARFKEQWQRVMQLLDQLCAFVGGTELKASLEAECSKILAEGINAKKEQEYASAFSQLRDQLERMEDKMGGMEEQVGKIQQRMMTESKVGGLLAQHTEELLRKLQQAPTSAEVAAASASSQETITLDDNKTYAWDPETDKLGNGAQGSVYKAKCTTESTMIAVKVTPKTSQGSMSRREFDNLSRVQHPNVVRFVGHGAMSDQIVLGMELVNGMSYDEYVEKEGGKLAWQMASKDFRQFVDGMAAVHALSIIHRDVKPANIIRKKNGRCVIVDFGLSKDTANVTATVTVAGGMVGTPAYCAPEILLGGQGQTSAVDVFTLGIILYEVLSGFLPWGAKTDSQERASLASFRSTIECNRYQLNLAEKPPIALSQEEAPPAIAAFITKCLANKPQDRFASACEMLEPWDQAVETETALEMQRGSEAQQFWNDSFPDGEVAVDAAQFKRVLCSKLQISEAAAGKLLAEVDADNNGSIELEEFLSHFSQYSVEEIANKFTEAADKDKANQEPDDVYFSKPLEVSEVKFKSKGSVLGALGGSKDRVGKLSMVAGEIVASRYDKGSTIPVYAFKLQHCTVESRSGSPPSVDVSTSYKSKTFWFKSEADRATFVTAFEATKAWQLADC